MKLLDNENISQITTVLNEDHFLGCRRLKEATWWDKRCFLLVAGFVLLQHNSSLISSLPGRTLIQSAVMVRTFPPLESPLIPVFYNVFLKDEQDEEKVRVIIDEQLSFFDPELHRTPVLITSIGRMLTNFSQLATIREHQATGTEGLTLHALWEYCKAHPFPEAKVVYIHSKGSFHDTPENNKFRPFVTEGALSKECANLTEQCSVCSSHFSTLPHPHTPGNMWLARCDYIAKLVDPYALQEGKLPTQFLKDDSCMGFGRYFYEHWVHSHPHVRPCDLYPRRDYWWGKIGTKPQANFVHDLQMAPRWMDFINMTSCAKRGNPWEFTEREVIRKNYLLLYNITVTPDDQWWYINNILQQENNTGGS